MKKFKFLLCLTAFSFSVTAEAGLSDKYSEIKWSDDKRHLLARLNVEGQRDRILVVDKKSKQVLTEVHESSRRVIDWCSWIDNNRFACQFKTKSHYIGELQGVARLVVYDKSGDYRRMVYGTISPDEYYARKRFTAPRLLKEKKSEIKIVDTLPNEERKILVLEYPLERTGLYQYSPSTIRTVSLTKLDIHSGKRTLVKRLSYAEAKKHKI